MNPITPEDRVPRDQISREQIRSHRIPKHRLETTLLRLLRKGIGPAPVRLRISGIDEECNSELRLPEVSIADRRTALMLLLNPDLEFGDAYSDGRIEVAGDLIKTLCLLYDSPRLYGFRARLVAAFQRMIHSQSLRSARKNVRRHYSLDTDFYRAWLDRAMVYTCAYFPEPGVSLESAQQAKLDLVCRKLWLQNGERVIEAGCGWGALA